MNDTCTTIEKIATSPKTSLPIVAKFDKVSFNQFYESMRGESYEVDSDRESIKELYDLISLPLRATEGSAGHDFVLPFGVTLLPGQGIKIPTGIRVKIKPGWFLACYPRSSLGFKYRAQLDNTVGIIDADYYYANNEGHIFAKITNDSKTGSVLQMKQGDRFMQGIFIPYGITNDAPVSEERTGGMGSTGA